MAAVATPAGVRFENVAYATDFQDQAAAALPYVLSIARKYQSKIHLVHVITLSPFSAPGPTSALRAIEAQAIREAKEAAAELTPVFGTIPNEVIVRKGNIWKELCEIVDQRHIDLIVAGTHGRSGVKKLLMGSVAEKILRHAPCPVLTIGPRVRGDADCFENLHSILVPTDFSLESLAALRWAISLAQSNHTRLYVLHVTPGEDAPESSLKTALRDLMPPTTAIEFAPKLFVDHGVPSVKILDLAEELAADLIVLGVKQPAVLKGTSTHQTMATAGKVIAGAGCPVITLRPQAIKPLA
jgi:nucleotide-binding universal stress UspA family protein